MTKTLELGERAGLVGRRLSVQAGLESDGGTTLHERFVALSKRRRGVDSFVARQYRSAAREQSDAVCWTVGGFLEWWLETMQVVLRPRTWEGYEGMMRRHVLPAVGSIPLSELSAFELHELYGERRDAGLSGTTVRHIHRVLHRALNDAERLGLISVNPARLIDAPTMSEVEYRTLDAAETSAFLSVARRDRYEALFVLAVTTGMRQGELLGLRWRDLDLTRGVVRVRRTVQWLRSGPALLGTKTGRSRAVYLSRLAIDALNRYRDTPASCHRRAGRWTAANLAFTTGSGGPLSPSNLHTRHFRPLLERAGLPRIRFHDLRHTAATLLLEQGIHPKVVAEMLGHARVGITLDIYSHVTPTLQQEAAAAFDALLNTGDGPHGGGSVDHAATNYVVAERRRLQSPCNPSPGTSLDRAGLACPRDA